MHLHTISIDIETYAKEDIKTSGLYRYAACKEFTILIIAYKIDDLPKKLLNLKDPVAVGLFVKILLDSAYRKKAFNAPFERRCLAVYFNIYLDPAQWFCTMAKAYTCGMSGGLDQVARILRIGNKMTEGKSLITYFCKPCAPTKANGMRTRNLPEHNPEAFARFEMYCLQDVELEYQVGRILERFKQPDWERDVWVLDQHINDYGIGVDQQFVCNAIQFNEIFLESILKRVIELTGIKNAKSVAQLKRWLSKEMSDEATEEAGEEIVVKVDSLGKDKIPALLKRTKDAVITEVLKLRQLSSKTSSAKYEAMRRAWLDTGRVHGMLQYYGASRTGRWAGRGIQLHNLPKNEIKFLDEAREIVKDGDMEFLKMVFKSLPFTLSQLIRTAFIPSPGHKLIPSDFSAIEARVIAWLAGEQWRLDVFSGHGKIYEASAAAMFGVPMESITKGSELRQAGKVAELALGYGGALGALRMMLKAEKTRSYELDKPFTYEPTDKQLIDIKDRWRAANPNIVSYWRKVDHAALEAIANPGAKISIGKGISFQVKSHVLFITLPSGRQLCYIRPRIIEGKFGPALSYEGTEKGKNVWGRTDTYGGKLVENIVQAISRDVLAFAMLRLDREGYKICLHVHDEAVLEVPEEDTQALEEINEIMRGVPAWAEGLPLNAESFETYYYKKE